MFFYLCQLIISVAGYAYPAYSSYKAVKANDAAQLELWLMYWIVMAFVTAAEMTVEWVISWVPFYWEFKTLIILWLTLPQIQGSTFVYVTFVHPFLTSHEPEIDATIQDAKDRAKAAGLEYLRRTWTSIRDAILRNQTNAVAYNVDIQQSPTNQGPPPNAVEAYPSLPWSPTTITNLLRAYGPSALAAGTALFHPMTTRTGQTAAANAHVTAEAASSTASSTANAYYDKNDTTQRRRNEFERELEAMDALAEAPTPPFVIPSRVSQSNFLQGYGRSPGSLSNGSLNRRSVSAAEPPRDPVATRIDQSLSAAFSYEDIRNEDLDGWDRRRSFPSHIRDDLTYHSPSTSSIQSEQIQSKSWWYGRWAPGTMPPSPRDKAE